MINIIGGDYKKTNLNVPLSGVRPTSSNKREAIFSVIESFVLKYNINFYHKNCVLDLFAGSGALGLEAISRGMKYGYFYENNVNVISCLIENCKKICINDNFEIKKENILENNFLEIKNKIGLVFIDPPYAINPFEKLLIKIDKSKILSNCAILILEHSISLEFSIPSNFKIFKTKKYKKTKISYLIYKDN